MASAETTMINNMSEGSHVVKSVETQVVCWKNDPNEDVPRTPLGRSVS